MSLKFCKSAGLMLTLILNIAVATTQEGLREYASRFGLAIGTCTFGSTYKNDATYSGVLKRDFNAIVAENEMKPNALHPQPDQFTFTTADNMLTWAQQNNMKMRGHTLIWHSQNPSWIQNNTFTREQGLAALKKHIEGILGHYKGKIFEWDIANECFTDGTNNTLRPASMSPWRRAIGDDYLDSAFTFAHRVDPDAILYYNDYNTSNVTTKSTAVYNKVKQMVDNGVPISGIGFQSHQTLEEYTPEFIKSLKQNFDRFAALGLKIAITELDIRITTPTDQSELEKQANFYREFLETALKTPACRTFMIWGFTDKYSWVPGTFPGTGDALIYTSSYQPKAAYTSLLNTMKTYEVGVRSPSQMSKQEIINVGDGSSMALFNLQGVKIGTWSAAKAPFIMPEGKLLTSQAFVMKQGKKSVIYYRSEK